MRAWEEGIRQESEIYFATPGSRAKSLFYYVTCAGHFYYDSNYHLERENYNSLLIMYVLNGSGKVSCYDKTLPVRKDDVVLLNCFDWHGYEAGQGFETLWVHFDGWNSRELFQALYDIQGCVMSNRDGYIIKKYLQKIYDMHAGGKMVNEALQSAYLSRILAEFFDWEENMAGRDGRMVEDGIQFMKQHLPENLTVKEIAAHVALSEFYFSRCFKKETGFTPYEYLSNLRVNRAKKLLKETDKSLMDIAEECGFSNDGNFIRTFKKHTDITPGVFRKMVL